MKAETALRRALSAAFEDLMVTANIGTIRSRDWASATFSGTRHELELRLLGSSANNLLSGLGEREFDLPGHILIDIAATEAARDGDDRLLRLEALTIEAD